ncbi:DUF1836 domain-containing protein [Hathewaya histolytica]|uniref:Protein of uncharacterized function (DUF1836) n=1 Tax=Hathewaya histolytica TaxID=1498 RepID=A0A4U9RUC8_HATHI|nr:DUF1836 domain-containing protein [Hathewaya histolytica]VTQ95779.1 protein of uncharacterised function (DUF1836) [Hathewaya histolytica]
MQKKEMKELIENLNIKENILLNDIPEIDLYMDQVIQLFEQKFSKNLRNDDDKVLTKTMINNYAKGKLFMPVKNKKYTKEHLILISLIYQLKGVLSIRDIKDSLEPMVTKINKGEPCDLREVYSKYLNLYDKNVDHFYEDIDKCMDDVENMQKEINHHDKDYIGEILLLTSLVTMSNLYKRVAESVLDNIIKDE